MYAVLNKHNRIAWGSMVLTILFCVFSCQHISAQTKFYGSAPKSVPVNQAFQLSYTIQNGSGSNLKLPAMPDFDIVGGPSTSQGIQWVNGNVTQSITYSYYLKPKKEGTFKIGKAGVQVSGINMESNELTVEVTKAVTQPQRQRNPYDPFADDPFFNQQQQEEPQASQEELEKQLKNEVFVKLSVNRNSVYKGEMLTATYKLYFRQNLTGFNVTKAPAYDGFWSQEVELDPKRRPALETINGVQYNTVEILKYNLYPQRAGNLSIAAIEVSTVAQIQVRGKSRSLFDDFFNMGRVQQVPLTLKTGSASINVKELPETGKPDGFAGAVGKFSYDVSLSGKETKTDEPITYSVKISGTGNLKFIESLPVEFPETFEVYDPKTKENITNGAGGLSGSKHYDYLLIPRQPGDYTIEGQQFSYFDPAGEKYFTIKSPEFTVKVTGEPSKTPTPIANTGTGKEDVVTLGQDIRYIKTASPVFEKGNQFFGSTPFMALYASPFVLFIGLLVVRRRNQNMAADVIGVRRRRALKQAKQRLSAASKYLTKADKKGFYDEVSRATWGYLGDKLNMDMAVLSKDNVEEKLLQRQVKAESITKLKSLLNTCELALYSPVGEGSEMQQNYKVALNLIADLEDEIRA